jgi:hypothetical protein
MPARARLPLALLLLGAPALVAGGCGGGAAQVATTVTLISEADIDGTIESDGTVSTGGLVLRVGDAELSDPDVTVASFLSFDLAGLPAAPLLKATLGVRINNFVGEPVGTLSPLLLDDVDLGSSLDAGDPVAVFASAVGSLGEGQATVHELSDQTARVAAALAAGRPRFQLRLRYAVPMNGDGDNDWINYVSSNSSIPASRPFLQLEFGP